MNLSGELESSHEYFCVFQQLPTAAIAAPLRTRTKTSVAPLNFWNLCSVFAEQFLALLNVLQLLLVEHILIAGMDAWTCHVLSFRVRRRSAHVPWWHPSVRVRLFLVPRKRVKTCHCFDFIFLARLPALNRVISVQGRCIVDVIFYAC